MGHPSLSPTALVVYGDQQTPRGGCGRLGVGGLLGPHQLTTKSLLRAHFREVLSDFTQLGCPLSVKSTLWGEALEPHGIPVLWGLNLHAFLDEETETQGG